MNKNRFQQMSPDFPHAFDEKYFIPTGIFSEDTSPSDSSPPSQSDVPIAELHPPPQETNASQLKPLSSAPISFGSGSNSSYLPAHPRSPNWQYFQSMKKLETEKRKAMKKAKRTRGTHSYSEEALPIRNNPRERNMINNNNTNITASSSNHNHTNNPNETAERQPLAKTRESAEIFNQNGRSFELNENVQNATTHNIGLPNGSLNSNPQNTNNTNSNANHKQPTQHPPSSSSFHGRRPRVAGGSSSWSTLSQTVAPPVVTSSHSLNSSPAEVRHGLNTSHPPLMGQPNAFFLSPSNSASSATNTTPSASFIESTLQTLHNQNLLSQPPLHTNGGEKPQTHDKKNHERFRSLDTFAIPQDTQENSTSLHKNNISPLSETNGQNNHELHQKDKHDKYQQDKHDKYQQDKHEKYQQDKHEKYQQDKHEKYQQDKHEKHPHDQYQQDTYEKNQQDKYDKLYQDKYERFQQEKHDKYQDKFERYQQEKSATGRDNNRPLHETQLEHHRGRRNSFSYHSDSSTRTPSQSPDRQRHNRAAAHGPSGVATSSPWGVWPASSKGSNPALKGQGKLTFSDLENLHFSDDDDSFMTEATEDETHQQQQPCQPVSRITPTEDISTFSCSSAHSSDSESALSENSQHLLRRKSSGLLRKRRTTRDAASSGIPVPQVLASLSALETTDVLQHLLLVRLLDFLTHPLLILSFTMSTYLRTPSMLAYFFVFTVLWTHVVVREAGTGQQGQSWLWLIGWLGYGLGLYIQAWIFEKLVLFEKTSLEPLREKRSTSSKLKKPKAK